MDIRAETVHDHSAVARINLHAFGGMGEPMLVALLRQRQSYDPDLSLVAEIDGELVGHALFTPYTIRLAGEDVETVCLAPIGVDPAHQKQGVGTALIEEGHRIAAAKGFRLSFLLGHTSYYPRFGYRTGAYGVAELTLSTSDINPPLGTLETRPVDEPDLPVLRALWQHEQAAVDFAMQPEDSLFDWLSPDPRVFARIFLHEGQIVGYARYRRSARTRVISFLAADDAVARTMFVQLAEGAPEIKLPIHPYAASARAFGAQDGDIEAWDAGMACPLEPGALDAYFGGLSNGRVPGAVIWPPAFDPL
ncbi:MAG: GNAT family N-acetyltransferase [Anaerolineae bacterium]|nr:GNAT family N-acetyltransferase [Anaerolineae bacterium]